MLSARLLDRSSRGVLPTLYGRALLKRSMAAFDELRQGMGEIEELADPSAGELRIGCPESVAAAMLSPVIKEFTDRYPRVTLHVDQVTSPGLELPQLRARKVDLALVRIVKPVDEDQYADDLVVEPLYEDQPVIAVGQHSPLARRRKISLADLVNERWILTPPATWTRNVVEEAFRAEGLKPPKVSVVTYSVHIRANLLASGRFVAVFPRSVVQLYSERFALKVLPLTLPPRPAPIVLATLKDRSLSPVAEKFISQLRAYIAQK